MKDNLIKIVEFLKSFKCKNVAVFDLSEDDESKFFVVASAPTSNDTKKLADELSILINYNDEKDGYCKGDWIILNADPIVVHLFTYAERSRYNLDKLYKSKEIDLFKEIKKKKSK